MQQVRSGTRREISRRSIFLISSDISTLVHSVVVFDRTMSLCTEEQGQREGRSCSSRSKLETFETPIFNGRVFTVFSFFRLLSNRDTQMTRLRVLLIRHGESHNNVLLGRSREAYCKERMADPPLSERGKLQAEHAALFLSIRDADSVSKRNVIFRS